MDRKQWHPATEVAWSSGFIGFFLGLAMASATNGNWFTACILTAGIGIHTHILRTCLHKAKED